MLQQVQLHLYASDGSGAIEGQPVSCIASDGMHQTVTGKRGTFEFTVPRVDTSIEVQASRDGFYPLDQIVACDVNKGDKWLAMRPL